MEKFNDPFIGGNPEGVDRVDELLLGREVMADFWKRVGHLPVSYQLLELSRLYDATITDDMLRETLGEELFAEFKSLTLPH